MSLADVLTTSPAARDMVLSQNSGVERSGNSFGNVCRQIDGEDGNFFFQGKARASFATEGMASRVWPWTKNGKEKADSRTTTRRMCVRIAPTLLGGMRTNTNCYVSCARFAKVVTGLFRVDYALTFAGRTV